MAIFGLGSNNKDDKPADTKPVAKKDDKKGDAASDEAKAILAKMEAKKDAGDCPFC